MRSVFLFAFLLFVSVALANKTDKKMVNPGRNKTEGRIPQIKYMPNRHERSETGDLIGKFCTAADLGGDCDEWYGGDSQSAIQSVLDTGLVSFDLYDIGQVWQMVYFDLVCEGVECTDYTIYTGTWSFRGNYVANLSDYPHMSGKVDAVNVTSAGTGAAAVLYVDADYAGQSCYYVAGEYPNMESTGVGGTCTIPNDSLSSVAVFGETGSTFYYYKNINYSDEITGYTSDQSQVEDNDECSSFVIEVFL